MRWSRLFVSRIAIGLALSAVVAASIHFTFRSRRFSALIVERVRVELANNFGVEYEVGSMVVDPLLLRVVLHDVHAQLPDLVDIRSKRAVARLDLTELLHQRIAIKTIELFGADVDIGPGSVARLRTLLNQRGGDPSRAGLPAMTVGRVVISDSRVRFGSVDIDLALSELELALTHSAQSFDLKLAVRADVLTVAGRPLAPARLDLEVRHEQGGELALKQLDLQLRAQRLAAHGRAQLDPIRHTLSDLDLKADAELDLGSISTLLGLPAIAEGRAFASAQATGNRDSPRISGRFEAGQVELRGVPLTTPRGDFSVSAAGVSLTATTLDMLGGRLTLDGRFPFDRAQPRVVDFRADLLDIETLARKFAALPVVSGIFSAHGRAVLTPEAMPQLDVDLELFGVEPALRYRVSDARLYRTLGPVDGNATVSIVDQRVLVRHADLRAPWYAATATGEVTTDGETDLCIELRGADAQAISRLDGPATPWREERPAYWLAGSLEGILTWQGTLTRPIIEAQLLGPALQLRHQDGPEVALMPTQISADYRDDVLEFEANSAVDSSSPLTVTGSLRFPDGADTERRITVRSPSIDAAHLAHLSTLPVALTGRAALFANLSSVGTADWINEIKIDGSGSVAGIPARRFALDIHTDGDRSNLREIALEGDSGSVTLTGIRDGARDSLSLELRATELSLGAIAETAAINLDGRLSGVVHVGGRVADWHARGKVDLRELRFRGAELRDVDGTVTANRRLMRVELASGSNQDLWVDVVPSGSFPFRATASFEALPLAPLIYLLLPPGLIDASGDATGALVVTGDLAGTDRIDKATLEMTSARLRFRDFELDAKKPWRIALDPQGKLDVSDLVLTHEQERLEVSGVIGLRGNETDLSIDGTSDLRLVRAFFPTLSATGRVALEARLFGQLDRLQLGGEAALVDGYLYSRALPYPLREIEARADLNGRALQLEVSSARFGGGSLSAVGTVDLDAEDGPRLVVEASGTGVRFILFEDLEMRAEPKLTYIASPSVRSLSGELAVTRAVYDLESGLNRTRRLGSNDFAIAGFPETALNLEVIAPSNLWLRSNTVKLEADARLEIKGSTADPRVRGSVRFLSQEEFEVEGRHYQVSRATLTFDNPTSTDPILDFEAESAVQGFDVAVRANGPLSHPRVSVSSIPPLTEGEALALLVGGRAQEDSGVAAPSGGQEILYRLLLPRAFSRLVGPYVSVTPTVVRGRSDPTEVVPLSIRIDKKVDVTVGVPLRAAASALAILNLRPWRNYTISIIRDLDRSWGGEALVERRYGAVERDEVAGPNISGIDITGLPTELEKGARGHLSSRLGSDNEPDGLRQDVERLAGFLRDAGYPLARVTLDKDVANDGRTIVAFDVQLNDPVNVAVDGYKVNRKLRTLLAETVQSFGLYAETEAELERVLRHALEEDGYSMSFVACERRKTTDRGAPLQVVCEVETGRPTKLAEVEVRGAKNISVDEVRDAVRERPGLFQTPRLVTARVAEGVAQLREHYHRAGFRNAALRAELREDSPGDDLGLIIHVDEGQRFKVGNIVLLEASARLAEELLPRLRSQRGQPFDETSIRLLRDFIFQHLDSEGRLDAAVRVAFEEHTDRSTVDITFTVDEGRIVQVRDVRLLGLRRTSEKLVRRLLAIHPGDRLSYGRIAGAQRRLYDAGIFRTVDIQPIEVASDPGLRDVEVRLEEAAPYRVELGGGYDSREGIRGVAEVADINFLGRGRYLGLYLEASRREGRSQLFLREPRLLGRNNLSALLTAFFERRREVSFNEDRWVFRTEVMRALDRRRRTRLLMRYSLSSTDLEDLQVTPLEADTEDIQLSTLGVALIRDFRDDLLAPRKGYFASADLEWSSNYFRSNADFAKLTIKGFHYRALSDRLVWATGAQLGVSQVGGGRERLPLSESYFAGGASTLRGLSFNQAGPTDPDTGKPTGGNALLVFNQELRYDLFGPIIASAFVDIGNVYRDIDDLGEDLRWSAGVGLRYRAAIVAGVDFARLLDAKPGEDPSQVRFSLGYAF